ncbi:MAG: glycosyltransferase family 4 protein [bacterium]|nr:glycosyltransferase family 4 protein [bacterium]
MRLLIATGIFPPDIGGPATYSKLLAEELVKRGHQVWLICYSNRKFTDKLPFGVVRVLRSRFKIWHYLKYFMAVKKWGREADVIYAQDPVSAGWPAMVAAKIVKKPFIVKVTGDYSWEQAMGRGATDRLIDDFQGLPSYPPGIGKIRDIQIHVCKSANKIITPAVYLKKLVAGWGVPEGRIEVVANAVAVEELSLSKAEVRAELGFAEKDFLVLSAGRPVKWKGFELLESVAEDIARQHPEIKLKILTAEPHDVLLKYLAAADVFVLNTGYEGFPHVVWEAMTLGTAVITTSVCGNPEIIQNKVNGLLVEFNHRKHLEQAILTMYKYPDFRKQLEEQARQTVKNSTVAQMVEKTERELIKLLPL